MDVNIKILEDIIKKLRIVLLFHDFSSVSSIFNLPFVKFKVRHVRFDPSQRSFH